VLRLNENKISGSLPSELSNLSGLETFEAPINVLTGIIPAGLSRSLKSLLLDDNELSGTLPEDLYGLGDLEVLLLGRNRDIVGTISSKIGSLTSLRELAIDYCSITGTIPSELGSLSSQLSILNLAGNQLKGTIPTELASLSGLRPEDGGGGIKVANEQVTGPVASVLCDAFTMVELCVVPEDCKCCSQSDQPGCKASSK